MITDDQMGPARRRGPLQVGDRVQLTDAKGRMHTIVLATDGFFQSHRGTFYHRELFGKEEGCVLTTREGTEFQVLRPLLADYVLSMPRGAAIIYPKDAAQIVQLADIFPGARVVEAGVGSGALSMSLLSAIGTTGSLLSVERRADFADIAKANVDMWFGDRHPAWNVQVGDLADVLPTAVEPASVDRLILDMLAPWENLEVAADALVPGGVLLCYVATVTQLSRLAEDLRATENFTTAHAWENMARDWHLAGLAVRPQHRMIGHTGFLLTARRLAPNTQPQRLASRPANEAQGLGGQWDKVTEWEPTKVGERPISEKRVRKVRRAAVRRANELTDRTPEGEQV